jgi:hypothetical protein
MEYVICSKCERNLPITNFDRNQSSNFGKNYIRPECKTCNKAAGKGRRAAKKLAGNPQKPLLGNPCDNCGRTNRKLVFDHSHTTLKHRGWLCDNCNRSIGILGDTWQDLQRTLIYLAKADDISLEELVENLKISYLCLGGSTDEDNRKTT